jgi:hypothetical protein
MKKIKIKMRMSLKSVTWIQETEWEERSSGKIDMDCELKM